MDEKKSFWKWSAMTTRKKVVLVAVFALALLWGIGGCAHRNAGLPSMRFAAYDGYPVNAAVAVKDFETLGIVQVSAEAKWGRGADVYNLLLKEAQKLGADGIINVRAGTQRKSIFSMDVTLTGSALAVKYTEAVAVPAVSGGFAAPTRDWFGRGFNGGRW
ncbi:MAG: hypothetical protein Pg6A_10170 [Termitinemataceae bacterium]|nr:MAG: hypothetical protein Pg6A_10170 [Termitinemataceae bacterium]